MIILRTSSLMNSANFVCSEFSKGTPDFFGQHYDSSPNRWEKGDDAALPVDPREETESGSKESGDEEVSKPTLVVVRVQAASVDLQDVELRYAEDPQRPSCLTNRCPELRLVREPA